MNVTEEVTNLNTNNQSPHSLNPGGVKNDHIKFNIGHLNSNRLRYKMDEIRKIRSLHNLYVLRISKIWLDNIFSDGELQIKNFPSFRRDQEGKTNEGYPTKCTTVFLVVTVLSSKS